MKFDLAIQVLVAFGLGLMTGILLGELAAPLGFVGTAFIRLLQISVIPYIIVALITGLGRLEISEIGKLVRSGGSVLVLMWVLGVILIMSMPLAYPDWPQRSLFQKSSLEPGTKVDFLLLFIPSNPFHAMANAIVPAVVFFSILIGLALTTTPRRELIIEPLLVLGDTLAKIASKVSRLSPIGVFALVAATAGTVSAEDLFRLQVHVVVFAVIALITALWLLPTLVASVTPLSHRDILRALRAPMVTAFATGSTLVVLPMLAESCKQLVDDMRSDRPAKTTKDEEEKGREIGSSVDILIPTFYSFPTIGNVLALGFIAFGGWYIGSPLDASQYISVFIGGIASLFGGTAIAIPFALALVSLPAELFAVFLSVDVLGGRLVALMSVAHYATIALIGTFALQGMIRIRPAIVIRRPASGIAAVLVILLGLRFLYTNYLVVPYTADDVLAGARLLAPAQNAIVHLDPPPGPVPGEPRSYAQILESGSFRACYLRGNYPLSFLNAEGDLVGFDIEMAHRFAVLANLSLVLLPLESLSDAAAQLDSGYCDAVFNSTSLLLDRTESTAQTEPIYLGTAALVVPETKRKQFKTWDALRDMGNIRIAQSAFHAIPQSTESQFPLLEFVPLASFEEQRAFFEGGGVDAEAFYDMAEEGAAWTILYPRFTVVVPTPIRRAPVVYLVARDNPLILEALNSWLLVERETGGVRQLEEYWIEGKRDTIASPRWSVVRNVFGWID